MAPLLRKATIVAAAIAIPSLGTLAFKYAYLLPKEYAMIATLVAGAVIGIALKTVRDRI